MFPYIARRVLVTFPVLLGVSAVVFLFVHLLPGDPARAIAGEKASEEVLERVRRERHLNDPVAVQYLSWLKGAVRGDLGRSYITDRSIAQELGETFPATVELALCAMLFALVVGLPVGVMAAARRRGAWDWLCTIASLIGVSVPVFFLGMVLLMIFAGRLPSGGRTSPEVVMDPVTGLMLVDAILRADATVWVDSFRRLILPSCALGTIPLAVIARMTRASLLETLASDYVRTARAKGAPGARVLWKHAFRNAVIPVWTIAGVQLGYLLAGAILTETVFRWPGLGRYMVDAITKRDYLALQGGMLLITSTFVVLNTLVDVGYAFWDPRIRMAKE